MVEISEIKNRKTFQAWLEQEDLPREAVIALAHRAAMRVAPLYWVQAAPTSHKHDLMTALPIQRSLLISGVAALRPTPDIKTAAFAAAAFAAADSAASASAAASAYASASAADSAYASAYAADSAYAAASASTSTAASASASAADSASAAAAAARASSANATWQAVRQDSKQVADVETLIATPLWPEENPLSDQWKTVRTAWKAAGPDWKFWIDWYDAALAGRPPYWDILEEIALIPAEDWDKGSDHVNALIAEIVESHRVVDRFIEEMPIGFDVFLDENGQKLTTIPISEIDEDLMQHIKRAIEKAIDRFQRDCSKAPNSNSGVVLNGALSQIIADLLQDLEDEDGNDCGTHTAIDDCLRSVRNSTRDCGLSGDPITVRLLTSLERCEIQILTNSPSAQKMVEGVNAEYFNRLEIEDKIRVYELGAAMAQSSQPDFAKKTMKHIECSKDENADPAKRRTSNYALGATLPRGAKAKVYSRFKDGVRVIDDPVNSKTDWTWTATVLGPTGAEIFKRFMGW